MDLHKVNDVAIGSFLAAAAAGKLGMFADGDHGLAAIRYRRQRPRPLGKEGAASSL